MELHVLFQPTLSSEWLKNLYLCLICTEFSITVNVKKHENQNNTRKYSVRIEIVKGLPNWIKVVFHTHSHVSSNDNLQTEAFKKKNIDDVLQYPLPPTFEEPHPYIMLTRLLCRHSNRKRHSNIFWHNQIIVDVYTSKQQYYPYLLMLHCCQDLFLLSRGLGLIPWHPLLQLFQERCLATCLCINATLATTHNLFICKSQDLSRWKQTVVTAT